MNQRQTNNHDDKSGSEMLSEIMRLLLKLLLKCIIKLLRLLIKAIKLLFALLKMLLQACADFWNDNSTQEKLRMMRRWCENAIRQTIAWSIIAIKTLGHWSVKAIKAIVRGMIWTAKAIVQGIIHMRPTIIRIGQLCKKALVRTGQGLKTLYRQIRFTVLRQKRAYQQFRKNKGFKGLLLDIKNHLQIRLNDYMDEGQEDKQSDALGYGEYIGDEIGDDTKTRSIGKKLYKGMNKLFDDDNE